MVFGPGLIPSPHPVVHIARYVDENGTPDEHGNYPVIEDPPLVRWVYSVTQFGRFGSSREVMGDEFEDRIDTGMRLACNDPTVYKASDKVVIGPDLDANGDWVQDSGTAYWVDGDSSDERNGPWPSLLKWSGGIVKIRRVT